MGKVLTFLLVAILCCIVALFIYVVVQSTVYATCRIIERKQMEYELSMMVEALQESEIDECVEVDFGHGNKCLIKKVKADGIL